MPLKLALPSWLCRRRRAERSFWRGRSFYLRGQYDLAIKHYSQAIEKDTSFAYSYDARGNSYGMLGNNARALKDYEVAAELMPGHAGMLGNLGRSLSLAGESQRALAVLEKAIELDPSHANNHGVLAHAYSLIGDHASALASYTKAIDLASNDIASLEWHYLQRGRTQRVLGDFDAALADFTKVICEFPTAERHQERAKTNVRAGQLDGSSADLCTLVERIPSKGIALFARGIALLDSEEYARAADDFSAYLARDPNNVNAVFNRAICYERAGHAAGMHADYELALALMPEPTTSPGYNSRAWANFALGRAETALADAERAVAFDAENAYAHGTLGHVLEALGQHHEAIASFGRALSKNPNSWVAKKAHEALSRLAR